MTVCVRCAIHEAVKRPHDQSTTLVLGALAALLLLPMACGSDDDGEAVREIGVDESGSNAAAGSSAESGSGSGSAAAADGSDVAIDDAVLLEAVEAYESYVKTQVEQLQVDAAAFTDAVRAGDVEGAKAVYPTSRQAWERIEPVAALIEVVAGKLDRGVEDFTGVDDPEWTGWRRLEHLVWEAGTLDADAAALADQLDADLAVLRDEVAALEISPALIAASVVELVKAADGKLDGEETLSSLTELWDIAANVEGSKQAFELLEDAVAANDAALVEEIETEFGELQTLLDAHRDGDGYVAFDTLETAEIDAMKAVLVHLAEELGDVAEVLGLD